MQQKSVSDQAICIAEGANDPTTPQADAVLQRHNISVLLDILVNSRGIMVLKCLQAAYALRSIG